MAKEFSSSQIGPVARFFSYVIMATFTILTIGPLIWMFYSSFKTHAEIVHNVFSLPMNPTIQNYIRSWKLGNLGLLSLNSIIYATVTTFLIVITAISTGYGFAKFKYKISPVFYSFFLLGILVTAHSVLVPLFLMEKFFHINNTRLGVFFPYLAFGLPLSVYLATTFIKGIPDSFEEAAVIDGAGYLQIFWRIILPVCKPVAATIAILTFLGTWNEFVFVFILTSKVAIRSLPVGLQQFFGGVNSNYGLQSAALVIGTIPMILFYVFFQKKIAQGFGDSSALKE